MSKTAFGLLWCFVFVIPWEEVVRLPLLGSMPRLVGVVAFGVGALHIVARRTVRPLAWFHIFAVLFVLWAGASAFWSIDAGATRVRSMTYLQLVLMVWLIWEVAWSTQRRRALLQAYVLGACGAAVATIYNYLSGVSLDAAAERFTALNANPNELGLTLVLGLPMAWYLSLSQPGRRVAWSWQLYLPLGVTGLLLTASRGAFLAALAALVIIPWTLGPLHLRTKTALYALAIGSLILATAFVPGPALERIGSTRAEIADGQFGGRGAIWKSGLQLVQEHPLAGVGAGAFKAAVEPMLHHRWSSHETFLSILVEEGIIGLLLFLAMVGAVMNLPPDLPTLERRLSIVLLAVLAVGSLSAAWDYQKQLWFVLGMLAAQLADRATPRASSRVMVAGTPGRMSRNVPTGEVGAC